MDEHDTNKNSGLTPKETKESAPINRDDQAGGTQSSSLEKQFILNATSPKPFQETPSQREARPPLSPTHGGGDRFEQVRERIKKEAEEEHTQAQKEQQGGQKSRSFVAPLRTYKDDISRAIQKQQESLVSVLSAESRRQAQTVQPESAKKQYRQTTKQIVTASLALLIIGGTSVLVFYLVSSRDSGPMPIEIPSYIFTEEQREIDITGNNRTEIMRSLIAEGKKVDLTLGSLSQFYLTEILLGEKSFVSADKFLSRLEVRAPSSLIRTLEPEMTIGVHAISGNQPFFIFNVDSFNNAFAGMLSWEDDINEDLAPLFGPALGIEGSGSITLLTNSDFEDKVIKNRDARILRDDDGETALLYSFLDKETLVITTNELTFNEIASRLTASRF